MWSWKSHSPLRSCGSRFKKRYRPKTARNMLLKKSSQHSISQERRGILWCRSEAETTLLHEYSAAQEELERIFGAYDLQTLKAAAGRYIAAVRRIGNFLAAAETPPHVLDKRS